jgi:hypothetical protein
VGGIDTRVSIAVGEGIGASSGGASSGVYSGGVWSELHPADLESGAPVVLLQFPSIAEQFQGYLDFSGCEVKRHSQYYF